MKIRTIGKTLRKRFDSWVETITDEKLREQVKKNTIITGGCIVSYLLKEDVNDIDLYFRDHDTCLNVAKYYATFLKDKVSIIDGIDNAGKTCPGRISIRVTPDAMYRGDEEASDESPVAEEGEDEKHEPVFFSSNAITLSGKVQVIVRFYGEPEEIHANYDFVHCTSYWKSWDDELVTPEKALQSILTRELRYVGSKYPLCSLIRTRKFIKRNWTINAGQMLKMVMQLQDLDLKNPHVLQDQLVGVDSAYFMQVLDTLSKAGKERIDTAYIIEIIDRIF